MVMQDGIEYDAAMSSGLLHRAAALALVVLTACGGAVERAAESALQEELGGVVDVEGDAYTVTDDTGTVRVDREVPADFDVPLLSGAAETIYAERRTDQATVRLVEARYPVARYDDLMRFFETYARSLDEPMERAESPDFLTTTWVTAPPDRTIITVKLTTSSVIVKAGTGVP